MKEPNVIQRVLLNILGLDQRMYEMLKSEKEARSMLKALEGPSVPFHRDNHKSAPPTACGSIRSASQAQLNQKAPRRINPVTIAQFNGYRDDEQNPDVVWLFFIDRDKVHPIQIQRSELHLIQDATHVELRRMGAQDRILDCGANPDTLH